MPESLSAVRVWQRGDDLPMAQRLGLTAVLAALGIALGYVIIPIGPANVAPFQHVINVLAGVLLGPWYAVLVALVISVYRISMGTGSVLAFPGSMFGAFVVGYAYHHIRRTDLVAFLEPLGTVVIGGLVGYLIISPISAPTLLFGFMKAGPPAGYLGIPVGPIALMATFAVGSLPGCTLGFLCLKALRRAGVGLMPSLARSNSGSGGG